MASSHGLRPRVPIIRCQSTASAPIHHRVVVVGGGWAGFGTAKHLAEQGYSVTLLDAAQHLGGVSAGWRTEQGRPVEAGTKGGCLFLSCHSEHGFHKCESHTSNLLSHTGFWYDYPNIYKLLRELDIEWPLTPFLTSGFWGGLITEAPVFSRQPQLPTLIGQFVHTAPLFYDLPLADRLSILPWLYNVVNVTASKDIYERYDKMSAYELFRLFGVTDAAYEKFLKPTLAVGLFAPPEELSAASVLETLYFYALSHQNSFDVCWCKGSISERLFSPMMQRIEAAGGSIRGGRLVTGIEVDGASGAVQNVVAKLRDGNEEIHPCDALVFAVSVSGMQKLVASTPELGRRLEFQDMMHLRSIDCIATRIWFDRQIPTRFPANVLAGFERDVGCTYFNLSDLQDEFGHEPGTVIAADFYGASSLLPLSDEAIITKVYENLVTCEPAFGAANIVDSAVIRCPRAVTHFAPGSYSHRPYQRTSFPNVFIAGDYVKGLDHGANGLSQERAYVTGLAAANMVIEHLGAGEKAAILPVEPDEVHISAAKQANKQIMGALNLLGLRLPFL